MENTKCAYCENTNSDGELIENKEIVTFPKVWIKGKYLYFKSAAISRGEMIEYCPKCGRTL